MRASLDSCWAKQDRALEQLKALDKAIKGWLEGNPYQVRENLDANTGVYELRIKPNAIPPGWSIIIGEILHDLRSALDHLVWQLTLANGYTPPRRFSRRKTRWRFIEFPIYVNGLDFRSRLERRSNPLWGISDPARAFIDDYQPLHGGKMATRDALWVLNELNNIDKHRTLHLTAMYLQHAKFTTAPFKGAGTITPLYAYPFPGKLKEDTVIFRAQITPPNLQMGVQTEATLDVIFDEGTAHVEGLRVGQSLAMIGAAVWHVLTDAKPFIS